MTPPTDSVPETEQIRYDDVIIHQWSKKRQPSQDPFYVLMRLLGALILCVFLKFNTSSVFPVEREGEKSQDY